MPVGDVGRQLRALLMPNFAWIALPAGLALAAVGVMAIDTVRSVQAHTQQTVNLPIALLCMLLAMMPHPRVMGRAAYPFFGISLGLLVFLLLPFVPRSIVPVINGARSWIDTPGMNFQPSEMTKVFFVLSLAWYFRFRKSHRSLLGLVFPFVLTLVPVMLIMMQPDLGTALVFAPALFAVLVAAGAKLRHLFAIVGLGTLVVGANIAIILWAPANMQLLKDHQQRRVRSMIKLASGDTSDIQADAYQQYKAMTLCGAGGVWGFGEERSREVFENFHLPEAHNDMIFAVIVNRWGMVGGVGVVGLYGAAHHRIPGRQRHHPRPPGPPHLRRVRGHDPHPGGGQRGHDPGHPAHHRHHAALHQLRRLQPAVHLHHAGVGLELRQPPAGDDGAGVV